MKYKQIIPRDKLFEINMSPSSLKQLASKISAKAGLEFEMIVPTTPEAEREPVPDYENYDESTGSIQAIFDFFYDGDYNGRRDANSLRNTLTGEFQEWQDERLNDHWEGIDGERFIKGWLRDNADASDWASKDGDSDSEERFNDYVGFVQAGDSKYYDSAREAFYDEHRDDYTESDWLDYVGLNRMSAIESRYDITWPHWTTGSEPTSIQDIADSFDGYLGRGVQTGGYHDVSRNTTGYIIETDSSLEADKWDTRGLEFVSPPLSINDMIEDLHKVATWANDYGCHTNQSCGLHMNVSVDNFSRADLDYIKLAVLCGDEYVQGQFGRGFGTKAHYYCKSAIGKIRDLVAQKPENARAVLEKMKSHLEQGAEHSVKDTTRNVHSNYTEKKTSLNLQNNRVEFRSPGGDWLGDYNKDPSKLTNTLLRFVVALDAAMDPAKYRQEYLKKLYKLLNPSGQKDEYGEMVEQFARYVTGVGGAPEQVVKDFRRVALQAIQKNAPAKTPTPDPDPQLHIEVYDRDDPYMTTITVIHGTADECNALVTNLAQRRGIPRTRLAVRRVEQTATGPRQATDPGQLTAPNEPGQMTAPNGVPLWQIVRRANGEVVHEFADHMQVSARERGTSFLRSQPGFGEPGNEASDFTIIPKTSDAPVEYRWPRLSGNRREWILMGNDQEVSRFQANSSDEAAARASEWITQQDEHWRMVHRPFRVQPA